MKRTLSFISSPWRRLAITVLMKSLLLVNRFTNSRARIHWIGRFHRRRRPERAVFALVFLGTLLAVGPQRHLVWMTAWGGALAIFLNLFTIYRLIPRKHAHWIR